MIRRTTGDGQEVDHTVNEQPLPRRVRRKHLPAADRKRQIAIAARAVFVRSGLNGARSREIADAAGVNEATLYVYFKNKEELFHAAILEPLESLVKSNMDTISVYRAATEAEEQIRLHKESQERFLATLVEIYPLLATALYSDPQSGKRFYISNIYPWIRRLSETQRAAFAGHSRNNLDVEFLSFIEFGAYLAVAMDHHFLQGELKIGAAVDTISEFFNASLFQKDGLEDTSSSVV
ncbi:MAG: TetR/AcrR family transcriptional regulator [Sphingomonadales bacterium]